MDENDTKGHAAHRGSGPLAEVTVLDLTRVVAGPYCALLLADMGATVIKIENPNEPDYVREFPPFSESGETKLSGFFAQYNRNKSGAALDLKTDAGKQIFLDMVSRADIVMENFRPGTMEKLGLGYDRLRECNPRLVYTAISGFGHKGPNSSRPAYDNSAQASGGLWSMNGNPGEPMRVGTIIGDLAAALYAAIGTLAALRDVERTGHGQFVDISQQDSVLSMTENAVVNYTCTGAVAGPLGNDHPFVRPYGRFECADGHVFFGAYTNKFWREACFAFGEPALVDDPAIDSMEKRFEDETYNRKIKPIIERWFRNRSKAELEAIAGDRFPLSPIKTIDEVVNDPHVRAREMIVPAHFGQSTFEVFGSPIKLSRAQSEVSSKVPFLGEHNRQVYVDWLEIQEERYAMLKKAGVI
jgi:CoA:oxalate CoA-transferase